MTPAPRRRCTAHIGLQLVIDALTQRHREQDDVDVDVRDPLIDLEHCPTCGQALHDLVEAR